MIAVSYTHLDVYKRQVLDRLNIIKPSARADAETEIDIFIDWWNLKARQTKPLAYTMYGKQVENFERLMSPYDQPHTDNEKPTLQSMREVESSANMYYYTEE